MVLWLISFCLWSIANPAWSTDDPFKAATHWSMTWEDTRSQRRGKGLVLHESSSEHATTRLLVIAPGGSRVIITSRTLPLEGTNVITIRDDATGWWMAVHKEYGFVGEHLRHFFYKAMDPEEHLDGEPLTMRLVTSEGLELKAKVQAADGPTPTHAAFVAALWEAGVADRLARQVPSELRDALPFLDVALSREKFDLRRVWDVLDSVTADSAERDGFNKAHWREVRGNPKAGLGISSPDLLELTAGFRSVENADPFTDVAPERR